MAGADLSEQYETSVAYPRLLHNLSCMFMDASRPRAAERAHTLPPEQRELPDQRVMEW